MPSGEQRPQNHRPARPRAQYPTRIALPSLFRLEKRTDAIIIIHGPGVLWLNGAAPSSIHPFPALQYQTPDIVSRGSQS